MNEEISTVAALALALGIFVVSPLVVLGMVLALRRMLARHGRAPLWLSALAVALGGASTQLVLVVAAWREPVSELGRLAAQLSRAAGSVTLLELLTLVLIEELAKTLAVALLLFSRRIADDLDGLFHGWAAGMGFAILENHRFFDRAPSVRLLVTLLVQRTTLGAIGHGTSSAVAGAGLGWIKHGWHASRLSPLAVLPALAVAVGWHSIWNAMTTYARPGDGWYLMVSLLQLVGAAVLVLWLKRALTRRGSAPAAPPAAD